MRWGSVTSIGVAYPPGMDMPDLAQHVAMLLGPVLRPTRKDRWPLRMFGNGEREVWAEVELREGEPAAHARLVEQLLGASHGELETRVVLSGVGQVEAVLRPQTRHAGVLLDLCDSDLYPEEAPEGVPEGAPERSDQVIAAIGELLLHWYDVSRFTVAFADHEAEFEVEPGSLGPAQEQYALVALPSGTAGGAPLRFHQAPWRLSPLGS